MAFSLLEAFFPMSPNFKVMCLSRICLYSWFWPLGRSSVQKYSSFWYGKFLILFENSYLFSNVLVSLEVLSLVCWCSGL